MACHRLPDLVIIIIIIIAIVIFQRKTRLDISCELSAQQTIHMKCQALFPLKNSIRKAYFKMLPAAFVIGVFIGLDNYGYQVNIFLISPRKHILWVLIRSTLPEYMLYVLIRSTSPEYICCGYSLEAPH